MMEISFCLESASSGFVIPEAIETCCCGCVHQEKCSRCKGRIEVLALCERLVKWKVCLHSSNLSSYLLTVLNRNSRCCGIVGVKCSIYEEPEDELMYADICISPELLSKLLVRRVRYFIVRARSSIANGVVSQYSATLDVDSDPRDILQLSRFIAEGESHLASRVEKLSSDLWRLQLEGELGRKGNVNFVRMCFDKMRRNRVYKNGEISRRVCVTYRGCSKVGLVLEATMIKVLCCSALTTIEIVGIR